MACLATGILPPAELLYDQLLALFGTENFRFHFRTIEGRRAELEITLAVAHRQHTIESKLVSRRRITEIDGQFLSLFDFVLTSTVGDDCVHVCYPYQDNA